MEVNGHEDDGENVRYTLQYDIAQAKIKPIANRSRANFSFTALNLSPIVHNLSPITHNLTSLTISHQ